MANWKSSFHGFHSGKYCTHAKGDLEDFVKAAKAQGFSALGFSEHAPRTNPQHLYGFETEKNITCENLKTMFSDYVREAKLLQGQYQEEISILVGFEAEYFPGKVSSMKEIWNEFDLDFCVGSVHYLNDLPVDDLQEPQIFQKLLCEYGGIENLALEYFHCVRRMIEELRPEVIGHMDLIKKVGTQFGYEETPAIQNAIMDCLGLARDVNAALDFNISPLRKKQGPAYPSSWILQQANDLGVALVFGDDSHAPEDVGQGLEEGREVLMNLGIKTISQLQRDDQGNIIRITKGLEA